MTDALRSPVETASQLASGDETTGGTVPAGFAAELRSFSRKLDRIVEANERSLALGRELVEQKAENLDLKRQVHRLEEELRFLKAGGASQGELRDVSLAETHGRERGSRSLRRKLLRLFGRA